MRSCCQPDRDGPSFLQGRAQRAGTCSVTLGQREAPSATGNDARLGARLGYGQSRCGRPARHVCSRSWHGSDVRSDRTGCIQFAESGRHVRSSADDRVSSQAGVFRRSPETRALRWPGVDRRERHACWSGAWEAGAVGLTHRPSRCSARTLCLRPSTTRATTRTYVRSPRFRASASRPLSAPSRRSAAASKSTPSSTTPTSKSPKVRTSRSPPDWALPGSPVGCRLHGERPSPG
jgi:hypothetical protein